jgi:hypothetical protein
MLENTYPARILRIFTPIKNDTTFLANNRKSNLDIGQKKKKNSGSELQRPSDRGLLEKVMLTSADRGCRGVSATNPHGRIHGFLYRFRYAQVAQIRQITNWL